MKKYPIILSTCLLLAVNSSLIRAADAGKPNILIILADDLGYGDVRCYNADAKVLTPNIDRLASEGMRFTDAHAPARVCTPSRYSLMTGQMAFRVPNGGTVFTGVGGPSLIAPGRLTLPGMLHRGNWKYIAHPGSGGNNYDKGELAPFALPDTAPGTPAQLYDLSTDPGETTNLFFKQPDIVKELKELLEQSKASGRSRP